MKEVLEAAISFFADLTWKRLRGFLTLAFLLIVAIIIFDSYTSYFTLNRLRHSAELISQLQTIESVQTKRSPELDAAYQALCKQVSEAVTVKPWTLRLSAPSIQIPFSRLSKFLASAAPWVLLSFIMLPDVFRRKPNSLPGFMAFYILAFFFGIIGVIIPTFLWPWGNLVIVPLFIPFIMVFAAAYVGIKAAQKERIQQAQAHASNEPAA